jgi:hypothetical protein
LLTQLQDTDSVCLSVGLVGRDQGIDLGGESRLLLSRQRRST